jgi:hypothetical protein
MSLQRLITTDNGIRRDFSAYANIIDSHGEGFFADEQKWRIDATKIDALSSKAA